MQIKAGIERAVAAFLEKAPTAPRHCGSLKPRIKDGTGPCSDRLGANPGESQPSIAATNKSLAKSNKTRSGAKRYQQATGSAAQFLWHRQVGETRCGVRAAGRHRPLAARSRNGQSYEKMYQMSRTARFRCPLP
jgi:hypothetical protein